MKAFRTEKEWLDYHMENGATIKVREKDGDIVAAVYPNLFSKTEHEAWWRPVWEAIRDAIAKERDNEIHSSTH